MYKFADGLYTDVRVEERFTTSVSYRNGALEESKNSTVKKAFIRVYDGNMWYYASTYRTDAIQEEIDRLSEMATPDKHIAENPVVRRFQSNKATLIKFSGDSVKDIPIEKKRAYLEDLFPAMQSSPYVKMAVGIYADRYSLYELYSSKGAEI